MVCRQVVVKVGDRKKATEAAGGHSNDNVKGLDREQEARSAAPDPCTELRCVTSMRIVEYTGESPQVSIMISCCGLRSQPMRQSNI